MMNVLARWVRPFIITIRRAQNDGAYMTLGLLSIAATLGIVLTLLSIVLTEYSYDRSFSDSERTYRLVVDTNFSGYEFSSAKVPSALYNFLASDVPEVEQVGILFDRGQALVEFPEYVHLLPSVWSATTEWFNIFDFEFVEGDPATALDSPQALVITELAAQRLFGEHSALGRRVSLRYRTMHESQEVIISGVIRTEDVRTHLRFDAITRADDALLNVWNGWVSYIYLRLSRGSSASAITEAVNHHITEQAPGEWATMLSAYLQPLHSIWLKSNLRFEITPTRSVLSAWILLLSAAFIFVLGTLTYMNMMSSRHIARSHELHIRRYVGATPTSLVVEYLRDSVITALICAPLVLITVYASYWAVRRAVGDVIDLYVPRLDVIVLLILVLCTGLGLLAASHPALRAVTIARTPPGSFGWRTSRASRPLRRGLSMAQFSVTMIFVFGSILVTLQLRHMLNAELGFDPENVYYLGVWNHIHPERYPSVRQRLEALAPIESVTYGSMIGDDAGGFVFTDASGETFLLHSIHVAPNYPDVLRMSLREGRQLSSGVSDARREILVNETAARLVGRDDIVGNEFGGTGSLRNRTVVGILDDFNFYSLHDRVPPLYMFASDFVGPYIVVRLKSGHSIDEVEGAWREIVPDVPFAPYPAAARLQASYYTDHALARLLALLGIGAFAIAILATVSITSYDARLRETEFAVRQVFGATFASLFTLVAREYALTFIASVAFAGLAVFVAYRYWIERFAYTYEVTMAPFVVLTLLLLLVVMFAIGVLLLRTSRVNPADSL